MRRLCVAFVVLIVALLTGCGGSTSVNSASPFAGSWSGTWVNVNDSADAGTSTWTIASNGSIDGQDLDPGRSTTFHVVGVVTAAGSLTSNSTPTGGSAATLDGTFQFAGANQFSGILAWGVTPVLNYRYSFTRN